MNAWTNSKGNDMKAEILRRITTLENTVRRTETPDLIIVTYDENIEKYVFDEDYNKKDEKGRVMLGGHRKTQLKDHYRDYVFHGNVNAVVIFMVMGGKEMFSVSFTTESLRKSCGIAPDTAFYVDSVEHSTTNKTETILKICTYERTV